MDPAPSETTSNAPPLTPPDQPRGPGASRRLVAVGLLGFASGAPNSGLGEVLPIWLATNGVAVELIGLLPLAGLPYAIKFLWAPLLDRWPIPWPDRRRGWIALLQLLLAIAIASLALLQPSTNPRALFAIGLMALIVAVLSATQDIVIDAYRTDLLPQQERGAGAAANSLGFRGGTLVLGSGALLVTGVAGYPLAFVAAGALMLLLIPCTLAAPELKPLEQPVLTLRQAVIGPVREFIARTGKRRAVQLLALVLLYRLPDGLLAPMSGPFLVAEGLTASEIGLIKSALGVLATMAGVVIGGFLFGRLGMNRSLWLFGIAGTAGNLAYWLVARGTPSLKAVAGAVLLENLSSGLVATAFVALLMSLCNPRFSATQYAVFSGVYAVSSKVLAAPSGLLVKLTSWEHFFLLSAAAAVPAFLLMAVVTPWGESQARGAFDPERDAS
ncbi:AmpG family muropeptide MFS transporter [Cyanobium sp. Morenito 9A2]|uniref:AmpG family muropeptide MFS transporter n=1 Tax=Cyanobium sp. Morenito 9A2 TaxID=2823718 RepID=UPI0020CCBC24|nr:MFS transporter [Cyanobium sp. Morenito 9A2]MCP9849171.1 MFS transporter [Cyanobium sp. Morenito 9A2]